MSRIKLHVVHYRYTNVPNESLITCVHMYVLCKGQYALQSDDSLMDDVEDIDFGIHNDNNNNDGNDENDGRMSGFIFF